MGALGGERPSMAGVDLANEVVKVAELKEEDMPKV